MPQRAKAQQTAETIDLVKLNADWRTYPEPTAKKRWVSEYAQMVRHTQGRIDEEIIKARRPYEPEEVREYREKNFRSITKSQITRAINALQRIFNKANVTITWPKGAEAFFSAKSFEDSDFMGYVNRFVIRRMVEDANGILVWWADTPPAMNERAMPKPILLLSENVLQFTPDLLTFDTEEKSLVTTVGPDGRAVKVLEGTVWYIVTRYGYYRREQYGNKGQEKFRIVPGYAHQLGYLPVVVLGGEEMMEARKGSNNYTRWFASYFEPCTQYGDEALHQFSDWQGAMVTSAQPMREMEPIKCPNSECKKGRVIVIEEGREVRKECGMCEGRGDITPVGPYGIIWRKSKRAGVGEEPTADPVPAIRFIHADPSILEQLEKAWRSLLQDMEKALHLLFIEEAQSGTAKEVDREDKVSTLDRIGENVFGNIVENSAEICLGLLKIPGEVVINLPATFIVRSDKDLREELQELTSGGVMPLYRAEATLELIRKRFPGDGRMMQSALVLAYSDLAFGYTNEEKAAMVAQGILSEEVVQRSTIATAMVTRLALEMGDAFLTKSVKDLATELDKRVEKELAERPILKEEEPAEDADR